MAACRDTDLIESIQPQHSSRHRWIERTAASVCDDGGLPLTEVVTAANVNDATMFQAIMEDIPPIRTPAGRRRTPTFQGPR